MKQLLAFFLFFALTNVYSQKPFVCGDQLIKHQLEDSYPGVTKVIEETFKTAKNNTSQRAAVLKIPVVFHVIYNNEEQNISEDIIRSQIDVLNEDFRRLNDNASETRNIFESIAADPEIEFFLAGENPSGNISNGITRTFTDKESFIDISFTQILEAVTECGFDIEDPAVFDCILEYLDDLGPIELDAMKSSSTGGKDAWDTDRYLNIWVANLSIEAAGMPTPFILGFAYPPMEAPNWPEGTLPDGIESKDGVVLHYQVVGRNNPNVGALVGINDQGRTAVHEVGHYLGLRHIWGNGDCTEDDGISDTPAAGSNSQATTDVIDCSDMHDKDSCVDDAFPDMIENYMDYSIERCQNMFTNEQVNLMRAMLEGPRSGLLENQISSVDNTQLNSIRIYPNPSSGQINVVNKGESDLVKVYNPSGLLLHKTNKSSISLDLIPGLYLVEISNSTSRVFKKVFIE